MNERAMDFILENELRFEGAGDMNENEDDILISAVLHREAYSRTVGVVNKTNNALKVSVDMTVSSGV